MEDGGKVLQSIALTDNNDPNSSPVTNRVKNSLPASVIPVTADSTSLAKYYGALVYFADYEGKLWKLNLTSNGTLYDLQYLFDSEADYANERRVMYDVAASIDATTNKLGYTMELVINNSLPMKVLQLLISSMVSKILIFQTMQQVLLVLLKHPV